jgi:hypothetical protein
MSLSRQRALRLSSEIRRNGCLSPIACDHCLAANIDCYVMPSQGSNSRLKCAECVRLARPCVNLSWESLDKTREEYAKKVEEDEALLATVLLRLMRNKKILKQAEERAKRKAQCLASEMTEAGELDDPQVIDCPLTDVDVSFSPMVWSTMGMLEDATGGASGGIGSVAAGSS